MRNRKPHNKSNIKPKNHQAHRLCINDLKSLFLIELANLIAATRPYKIKDNDVVACKMACSNDPVGAVEVFSAAAIIDRIDIMTIFLKAGFNPDQLICVTKDTSINPRPIFRTALMLAADLQYEEMALLLLSYHAKVDFSLEEKSSALFFALKKGNKKIVEAMMGGEKPAELDNGALPLALAGCSMASDQWPLLISLFEQGLDVNKSYLYGDVQPADNIPNDNDYLRANAIIANNKKGRAFDNDELWRLQRKFSFKQEMKFGIYHHPAFDSSPFHVASNDAQERMSALSFAIKSKNFPYAKLLLQLGAALNYPQYNFYALTYVLILSELIDIDFKFARYIIEERPHTADQYSIETDLHPYYHLPNNPTIKKELGALMVRHNIIALSDLSLLELKAKIIAGVKDRDFTKAFSMLQKRPEMIPALLHYRLCLHLVSIVNLINMPFGIDLFNLLLDKCTEHLPGMDNQFFLHVAVVRANLGATRALLSRGLSIHAYYQYGNIKKTPLDVVLDEGGLLSEEMLYVMHKMNAINYDLIASQPMLADNIKAIAALTYFYLNKDKVEKKIIAPNPLYVPFIVILFRLNITLKELGELPKWLMISEEKKIDLDFLASLQNLLSLYQEKLAFPVNVNEILNFMFKSIRKCKSESIKTNSKKLNLLVNCLTGFVSDGILPVEIHVNIQDMLWLLNNIMIDEVVGAVDSLLKVKKPKDQLIKYKDDCLLALIALNKQAILSSYLADVFSVDNSRKVEINALTVLVHDELCRLKKEIVKVHVQAQLAIQASEAQCRFDEEQDRLLSEEKARINRQAIREEKWKEQSEKDRVKHEQSFVKIDKTVMKYKATVKFTQVKPVRTVGLTADVVQAFSLLAVVQGSKYLIGSVVINLLYPDRAGHQYKSDIDVISIKKTATSLLSFLSLGFFQSRYIPGLATYKSPQLDIDVVAKDYQTDDFMMRDAKKRDFTICAIYCDDQGRIYDPTKRGLADLENKMLSTILSASRTFQKNPVCILRAIKYLLRGYRADEDILIAFANDYSAELLEAHKDHLHACMRKHLYADNAGDFVALLIKHQLHYKLFGIRGSDIQDVIAGLWEVVAPQPPRQHHAGMLNSAF